jgi:hypothetical protein
MMVSFHFCRTILSTHSFSGFSYNHNITKLSLRIPAFSVMASTDFYAVDVPKRIYMQLENKD